MDKDRTVQAAEVLRRLDEIGAIKLDVLAAKASEIQSITGMNPDDDDHGICYRFYIRVGPPRDVDLVSVASQLKQLGFELKRVNVSTNKAAA
jgi:hypothetical protein